MERLPVRVVLLAGLGLLLVGCGSSEASVSKDEEQMFKHPGPVDRSKIPANPFKSNGPAYIGEPTKGTGASGPPAGVVKGG